ncbi:MAG: hypothetical protein D9C04_05810 [Nitrosopumilus sp. B06]|nr:MAG: hypothetical protein D9C04_05810 [Nitrosopumilus sp. B06]
MHLECDRGHLMSRPKKSDHDGIIVPGSNYTLALVFAVIRDGIRAAVKAYGHLKGFTYSPKSGLVFNVEGLHDTLTLFRELIRGSRDFQADQPIYLIAVICHKSIEVDDVLRKGYETIARFSNQPLIGYWNPPGRSYLDAVVSLQFISNKAAIDVGKRYGQEYILTIWPNGDYEHFKTD